MPTSLHKIFLILILFIATLLRVYQLDSYPPINPDEAAIGYNAYSLLLTGKDEHGISWPLHFRSFGDYKPGGYFYFVLPFIKLLGLNTLAVRLPNLILSILGLYFFYKLILLFTQNKSLSFLSLLVLSLNPWHIHFSRGGWEASTALSLIIIGTYSFYSYFRSDKIKYLYIFIIFFALSIYTYHSARIFAPLLGVVLLFLHRSYFQNHKKVLIKLIITAAIITLPVLFSFINNGGTTRFGGVGLTADHGPLWRANELINQHQPFTKIDRVIHNKRILYLLSWVQKYSSHFDFNYLFITGDDVPRSKVPDMGQLYLLELPLFLLGLYCFFHNSYFIKHKSIILAWLIIAPLASSLTFQAPSALRSLPMAIPFTVFISLGLYIIILISAKLSKPLYILSTIIITIGYLANTLYYLDSYFIHYQKRFPQSWGQGFDQIIPYLESQKNNYQNIFFTDKYDQPYILYLFFSKYPPANIQSQIKLSPPDIFGFSTVRQIDNISFVSIDWPNIPSNSLVIASNEPVTVNPIKIINFANNQPQFKIYTK